MRPAADVTAIHCMLLESLSTSSDNALVWVYGQVEVCKAETVQELVNHANRSRSTGSTGVNEDSSRSHSIMQVSCQITSPQLMQCPVLTLMW